MQLIVQLFAATVCGNRLNAEFSGWGFLIGFRQQLLQAVPQKVAYYIVAFRSDGPVLREVKVESFFFTIVCILYELQLNPAFD